MTYKNNQDDLRYHLGELPIEDSVIHTDEHFQQLGHDLVKWAESEISPIPPKSHVWDKIAAETQSTSVLTSHSQLISPFNLRLWQAAAVILLLLNLFWLLLYTNQPKDPTKIASNPAEQRPIGEAQDDPGSRLPSDSLSNTQKSERTTEERITTLIDDLTDKQQDIRALEHELAIAQDYTQTLENERLLLSSQLEGFFLPVDGKAQITLVSMATESSPFTRADLNALLTLENRRAFTEYTALDGDLAGASSGEIPEDTILPTPTAVAVWRNDLQEGVVNFYNIPELPEGSNYELWAEDAGTGQVINFGELPEGSTGDFSLTVTQAEDSSFSPASLSVTIKTTDEDQPSVIFIWGPGNPQAEEVEEITAP